MTIHIHSNKSKSATQRKQQRRDDVSPGLSVSSSYDSLANNKNGRRPFSYSSMYSLKKQRRKLWISCGIAASALIWILDRRLSSVGVGSSLQEVLISLPLQQQEQQEQQQTIPLTTIPFNESCPMCIEADRPIATIPPQLQLLQQERPKPVAVYLVTRDHYVKQLYKTLQYLDQNWLSKYPMPIVFFYSGVDPNTILQTARWAMTNDTLRTVHLQTVQLHRTQPPFFNRSSVQKCLCCCNGLPKKDKIHKGALRGGQYHADYCYMNRFRTFEMYRHPALAHYDYFVQMDTDTRVLRKLPYDPIQVLHKRGSVYGFAWQGVRKPNHDCNLGLFTAIDHWMRRVKLVPQHKPERGTFWSGSFNMGRLDFFRSSEYYRFARWINNRATGIWTARWGDEIFLPHIISAYHGPANISHFYKWHRNKVIVHKSKSVGRKKNETNPKR
eukprot:CAMPEP_0168740012 /NCGR_PEP_ID=MMETSP0724-20121128/11757_1 /TAXON_ID=265536 /ORGANISM="Amphiprora sp., Strain CCMP467" /LENGTH=440 /DNA_ID=CAMNT_0008787429 /DNA_START=14 /DNA_END=1336 /DNA_ORIENTATION=-